MVEVDRDDIKIPRGPMLNTTGLEFVTCSENPTTVTFVWIYEQKGERMLGLDAWIVTNVTPVARLLVTIIAYDDVGVIATLIQNDITVATTIVAFVVDSMTFQAVEVDSACWLDPIALIVAIARVIVTSGFAI